MRQEQEATTAMLEGAIPFQVLISTGIRKLRVSSTVFGHESSGLLHIGESMATVIVVGNGEF